MKAPLALGLAALGLLTTGCSMTPTSSSVMPQGRKSGTRATWWGLDGGGASRSERSSVSASRTISEPGTREFELPLATHPARHAVSAAAPRSTAGPEKQDKG